MSTVQRVNLEPVSSLVETCRRDFPLADPTLADPTNSVALVDGEWVTLDSTSGATQHKLIRATTIGSVGNPAAVVSFPVFMEKGRYDGRAMADKKWDILFLGEYECDTRIFDASAVVGSGAAITTLLQPLKVATITIGSRNYSGLVGSAYTDNAAIVGYTTRLPAANGGKLRFIRGWAVRNGTT